MCKINIDTVDTHEGTAGVIKVLVCNGFCNRKQLGGTYWVPDPVISPLAALTPVIPTSTMWGRCYHFLHFAIEETNAERNT